MNDLIDYLDALQPLSPALRAHLTVTVKVTTLGRREYLLHQGRICYNIYFVQQGLLRSFYLLYDKEVCAAFMKENDLVFAPESFFRQQPSTENIQALDPCVLHYISYGELQIIYRLFPEFNCTSRKLLERYYLQSEQRLRLIRMHRSAERYDCFQACAGDLVSRVPAKYIASYIGVTEETFSRIRRGA